MLRRLLHAAYDIQSQVHNHEALPRDLVDMAERAILEVAHRTRARTSAAPSRCWTPSSTSSQKLSLEGNPMTGTPSGYEDLDTITAASSPAT